MPKKKSKEPNLVDEVVAELKPQLKEAIESVRIDILNDVKELVAKATVPTPQVAPADVASQLTDSLKGGNIDLSKISGILGTMNQTPMNNGQVLDMDKMTTGQVAFMKMQQQNALIGQALPLLAQVLSTGSSGGGFSSELMMRMFLEQIGNSSWIQRQNMRDMQKRLGEASEPLPPSPMKAVTEAIANKQAVNNESK